MIDNDEESAGAEFYSNPSLPKDILEIFVRIKEGRGNV